MLMSLLRNRFPFQKLNVVLGLIIHNGRYLVLSGLRFCVEEVKEKRIGR